MPTARLSWTTLVLGASCLSILGYALLLRREVATLRENISRNALQQTALRSRDKAQGISAASKAQAADSNGRTAVKELAAPDSAVTAAERENMLRIQEEELRNKNRMLVQKKNSQKTIQRNYGYVLEALAPMDAATSAKLKEALAERELIMADVRKQASIRGIDLDSAEYDQLKAQTLAGPNAEIAGILGEKSAQFFEWDRVYGAVAMIELGMKYNFEFADAPLDRETTLKLAKVMTDLNYAMNNPKYPALIRQPVSTETGLTPLYSQLLARSASFLSARQLEVLRAQQDEVLANLNQ